MGELSAKVCGMAQRLAAVGALLVLGGALVAPADAQSDELPPVKKPGLSITFLPPPMEGTLSMGVYDKAGKLVRTLHQGATEKAFVVGLNGFITRWDGKDNAGQLAPAGRYSVRGYAVGSIEVEGIAFHCNEWIVDDESPRIAQIVSIAIGADDTLRIQTQPPQNPQAQRQEWLCDRDGKLQAVPKAAAAAPADTALPTESPAAPAASAVVAAPEAAPMPGVEKQLASCPGKDGSTWVIDQTRTGIEVKEFSKSRELNRRLSIAADQPQPTQIAASTKKDVIYLLERGPKLQRLRGLELERSAAADNAAGIGAAGALVETDNAAAASTWSTFLSKTVMVSDSFAAVADQLGRAKPFVVEDKIRLRLMPNPLFNEASHDLDVRIGVDAQGAFFQTADGLPLLRVTETPNLKWAVMGREGGKAITVFDSDGAVVEEFKAHRLANTMAFDAGVYEWAPAKEK